MDLTAGAYSGERAKLMDESIEQQFMNVVEVCANRGTPDETPDDPIKRAFYAQAEIELSRPGPLSSELLSVFADDPTLTASDLANRLFATTQLIVGAVDRFYPFGRNKPSDWAQDFKLVTNQTYFSTFQRYIRRDVQSNVANRGKVHMLAALIMERTTPLRWIALGSGSGNIEAKLALLGTKVAVPNLPGDFSEASGQSRQIELKYGRTSVAEYTEEPTKVQTSEDVEQTAVVNLLLHPENRLNFDSIVCIDQIDPDDPEVRIQSCSNSLYPVEQLGKNIENEFNALIDNRPPYMHFYKAKLRPGFSVEALVDRFPFLKGGADVVTASAMLYQQGEAAANGILGVMEDLVAPGGLLIASDIVEGIRLDGRVTLADKWVWNYRTFVKDMAEPRLGYQEWFRAKTGRCNTIMVQRGLGELALG